MGFRSSSGRCAPSRHLAESHPQVLIIALLHGHPHHDGHAVVVGHRTAWQTKRPTISADSRGPRASALAAAHVPAVPSPLQGRRVGASVIAVIEDATASPDFVDALTRLPFAPLGPANWRSCVRAISSHTYGASAGFVHLGLTHRTAQPAGKEQWLTIAVSAQAPFPTQAARAIDAALRRMTTLAETAAITWQGRRTGMVLGDRCAFLWVVLSDGQWSAVSETGSQSISASGRGWPSDGLELVEVDPLMYLDAVATTGG